MRSTACLPPAAGALLCLAMLACGAMAQGNDSQTPASQPQEQKGGVTIGAGSTSNVTTGASGVPGQPGATLAPIATHMPYPPQSEGPLGLPGKLPIVAPAAKRCDVISDAAARRRCAAPAVTNASTGR
ncbi:MAG: hypothetical protein NW223_21310 [Hyphomicrobiaceae bacterium]|nr:hypothetical protein [Hyphomicrobiaceae bacterium]